MSAVDCTENIDEGQFMKMATVLLASVMSFSALSAGEEKYVSTGAYGIEYENGVRAVQQGDYKQAFPALLQYAKYGEKMAQYLVGTLLLTDEVGPRDVDAGLAWLNVALEQDTPLWRQKYDAIVEQLPADYTTKLEPLFNEYKQKFGAETQAMRCKYERATGSNRRQHICRKIEVIKGKYKVVEF